MSFNMWQKLMAASTENAVVAACCEVVDAVDALTMSIRCGRPRSLAEPPPHAEEPRAGRPLIIPQWHT
jgi:hypothetical protein